MEVSSPDVHVLAVIGQQAIIVQSSMLFAHIGLFQCQAFDIKAEAGLVHLRPSDQGARCGGTCVR